MKSPLFLPVGTVGFCKSSTMISMINAVTAPKTELGHCFLVWDYLPEENDYIILESLNKGITVSRMAKYRGKGIRFFDVNCPPDLKQAAPVALTKWGESGYDWGLIIRLALVGFLLILKNLITELRLRRLRAEELPYNTNVSLVCTEAVQISYLAVGVPIIDPGIVPTPSTFEQAIKDGMLVELQYPW